MVKGEIAGWHRAALRTHFCGQSIGAAYPSYVAVGEGGHVGLGIPGDTDVGPNPGDGGVYLCSGNQCFLDSAFDAGVEISNHDYGILRRYELAIELAINLGSHYYANRILCARSAPPCIRHQTTA